MTDTTDQSRRAETKPTDPDNSAVERQQLEREWADAVRRGLRKGKPPADLGKPKRKPATKKGKRR